jgi:hypothetical protein
MSRTSSTQIARMLCRGYILHNDKQYMFCRVYYETQKVSLHYKPSMFKGSSCACNAILPLEQQVLCLRLLPRLRVELLLEIQKALLPSI